MTDNEHRFSAARLNELAAKKIEQNARDRAEAAPLPDIPLNFSVEVNELLNRAESDQASAMKLLEMLARDLRARILPNRMLADHVADAIEWAAAKPVANQARSLTDELYLTSQERRPAHSWLEVGRSMDKLIDSGMSQTKAKLEVAVKYGVDEKTALKYLKAYNEAKKLHDSIE
jgi:hypothetical protein